jgi:tetratricopeptide (TPR) repeat protein
MREKMRGKVHSYLELAADYLGCGMWGEAVEVLERPVEWKTPFVSTYPLVHYYLGYLWEQKGCREKARACYARAAGMPSDYCFPFRLEERDILDAALAANPSDARAYYYLGNLLFDLQPEVAMICWEKSSALDDGLATVHRNLGWAQYRVKNELGKAVASYEKALGCNQLDPRLFLELDTLYEFANVPPERRLAALEKNHEIVVQRKDSFVREIMVLVLAGKYDRAIDYLANNFFAAREGSREIHDVYVDAHLLRGLGAMKDREWARALHHFQKASEYPENLSVGRPENDRRAPQVLYHTATAHEALGERAKARELYERAAKQPGTSGWPETRYYQGLCLGKLGEKDRAGEIFDELIRTGNRRLGEGTPADFFAKFGEQETKKTREASARYLLGLGRLGKGAIEEARQEFEQAVKLNLSHVWARYQLASKEEG